MSRHVGDFMDFVMRSKLTNSLKPRYTSSESEFIFMDMFFQYIICFVANYLPKIPSQLSSCSTMRRLEFLLCKKNISFRHIHHWIFMYIYIIYIIHTIFIQFNVTPISAYRSRCIGCHRFPHQTSLSWNGDSMLRLPSAWLTYMGP